MKFDEIERKKNYDERTWFILFRCSQLGTYPLVSGQYGAYFVQRLSRVYKDGILFS